MVAQGLTLLPYPPAARSDSILHQPSAVRQVIQVHALDSHGHEMLDLSALSSLAGPAAGCRDQLYNAQLGTASFWSCRAIILAGLRRV